MTPAGKACLGETTEAQDEEAPRPPAESECLKRKSTSKLYKQRKLQAHHADRSPQFVGGKHIFFIK
ncbi:hypothetical protein B8W99_11735 [Peribacillus simplex]|nr:hypothetical protein B8W99_11735 [Peribacillus simplex]